MTLHFPLLVFIKNFFDITLAVKCLVFCNLSGFWLNVSYFKKRTAKYCPFVELPVANMLTCEINIIAVLLNQQLVSITFSMRSSQAKLTTAVRPVNICRRRGTSYCSCVRPSGPRGSAMPSPTTFWRITRWPPRSLRNSGKHNR